jgi:hypothetical protein
MVLLRDSELPDSAEPIDVRVFTVQGHPEFTASISNPIIDARTQTGVLSDEIATDARKRNEDLHNDGVEIIGRLMWRIMGV